MSWNGQIKKHSNAAKKAFSKKRKTLFTELKDLLNTKKVAATEKVEMFIKPSISYGNRLDDEVADYWHHGANAKDVSQRLGISVEDVEDMFEQLKEDERRMDDNDEMNDNGDE